MNNNIMQMFGRFMQNPMQYMQGIPKEMQGNPQAIIQRLMDSGQMTQEQYNRFQQMASQMRNNPMFRQFFK